MSPPAERPAPKVARELAASLERGFEALDPWLDVPEDLWTFASAGGGWSVGEVVEHVSLANRYLLILVEKLVARARKRLAAGAAAPAKVGDPARVAILGERTFGWSHPDHMAPGGPTERGELRATLRDQRARCLEALTALPPGAGALHGIRMSVVDARLDLYQYLAVIEVHLARHLRQLARLGAEHAHRTPPGPRSEGP